MSVGTLKTISLIHCIPQKIIVNILFLCSYYIEILLQENAGVSFVNIGLFHKESTFTEDQTDDAVNEVQNIVAEYDVFDEEQVCGN